MKTQTDWAKLLERSEVMSKTPVRRGMKFKLGQDVDHCEAKAGDVVKVTSVQMGLATGLESDYERIRVSNGKFSWRTERCDLIPIKE